MNMLVRALLLVLLPLLPNVYSPDSHYAAPASTNPLLLTREWEARWIAVPDEPADRYGVYLFRKSFDLATVPKSFMVHVTADNRYKLHVNGTLVSLGPARGDIYYWNYETVDLAPYLRNGRNVLAAKVWSEGNDKPEAQISWRTGFLLQGDTEAEKIVNSGKTWKCTRDESYQPLRPKGIYGYYVAGPGEYIDMKKHIRGWENAGFDDAGWKSAVSAGGGSPKGLPNASGWMLVPSQIPQMELSPERLKRTREAVGIQVPEAFPAQRGPVVIPARTEATLLLDNETLTNAYLTLRFSRGRDATVSIKYAEALYAPASDPAEKIPPAFRMLSKGNRNEVKGKTFLGREDRILSDGTTGQAFTSLYWRTYRYILLKAETRDEPLVIDDIYGTFTGYPFKMTAELNTNQPELTKILETGWRTARLCAMETYMDCPYYEQLQYIGDARIQALVSYYNSGDDRLARNALNQMDHSRISEGITLSRHPSATPQIISTFSLWYIGMLHDYWMYRPDAAFVKEKVAGIRSILNFFAAYQQADGSLKNVPYWNFTDWVVDRQGWVMGVAPTGKDGGSAVLDLQLALAYQVSEELEHNLGLDSFAQLYHRRSQRILETVRRKYWDEKTGMLADTSDKESFSQHANSLAILTGLVSGKAASELGKRLLADSNLAPASIYFKYYLHQALTKAGMGNDYLQWLDKWRENLAMGLTTWAEDYEVNTARSDCHAWGSSPNVELYRTLLGIETAAPGFSRVKIEPNLGALERAAGVIPHPKGFVKVRYERKGAQWEMNIQLPPGIAGTLLWQDKNYPLKAGSNALSIAAKERRGR